MFQIQGQLLTNSDVDSYQIDLDSPGTLSAHFVAPGGGTPTRVYWLIQIYWSCFQIGQLEYDYNEWRTILLNFDMLIKNFL